MMELGATVCTARAPRCDACPVRCVVRERRRAAPARAGRPRRARASRTPTASRAAGIVAALLAGEPLPDLAPERLERALAGLARDGLIVHDAAGGPALP